MSLQVSNVGVGNSTTTIVPSNIGESVVARSVVLGVIHLVNFVGNLLIVISICHSRELRKNSLNIFIVNLCVSNLLGAILSVSLALGYSASESWDFGVAGCQVNAYLLHFIDGGGLVIISAICADRLMAVRSPVTYATQMRLSVVAIMSCISWLLAGLTPLPFVIDSKISTPQVYRFVCGATSGSPITFWLVLYTVLYLVPNIVIIFVIVSIVFIACQDRHAAEPNINYGDYTDATVYPEPPMTTAINGCKLALTLWLLWLLCFTPYLTVTFIEASQSSAEVGNTDFSVYPTVDTSITWLKFFFPALTPFAILFWLNSVWQKLKDIALVRKSNLVTHEDVLRRQKQHRQSLGSTSKSNFKYPTVIANQTGLHVEYTDNESVDVSKDSFSVNVSGFIESGMKVSDTEEANYYSKVKDGSDTSDYDTDQLAQSNPLSVKSSKCNTSEKKGEKRSVADPFRKKANSVSADSGIASVHDSAGKMPVNKRAQSASQLPIKDVQAAAVVSNPGACVDSESEQPVETTVEEFRGPPVCKDNNLVGSIQPSRDQQHPNLDGIPPDKGGRTDRPPKQRRRTRKSRVVNGSVAAEITIHESRDTLEIGEPIDQSIVGDDSHVTRSESKPPMIPPAHLKPIDMNKISPIPSLHKVNTYQAGETNPVAKTQSKALAKPKRKKKRQKSTESEKPLLSSNTSTDMNAIKTQCMQYKDTTKHSLTGVEGKQSQEEVYSIPNCDPLTSKKQPVDRHSENAMVNSNNKSQQDKSVVNIDLPVTEEQGFLETAIETVAQMAVVKETELTTEL